MVQEDSISAEDLKITKLFETRSLRPVVPVEDTLDVFFFLTDPLSEVSVSEKK